MVLHNKKPKNWKKRLYDVCIIQSWWVWAFAIMCYFFYGQGMKKKQQTYEELYTKAQELQIKKLSVLRHREDLLLEISSQNDPAWIELTLMRRLGMVPEGQKKVYFKKEE